MKIRVVLAWIWVAVALLLALGAASDGAKMAGAAVALLVSAGFALPLPVVQEKWAGIGLSALPRAVPSAVAGVLGLVLIGINAAPPAGSPTPPTSAPVKASAQVPAPQATTASPDVTAAMKTFYRSTIAALTPCDEAVAGIAKVASQMKDGSANIYDGYSAAKGADDTCFAAFMELGKIEVPDALEDVAEDEADKALETCRNAAVMKRSTAQAASTVFNGDTRPSAVNEFQENAKSANGVSMACVVRLLEVATKAKVDMAVLK